MLSLRVLFRRRGAGQPAAGPESSKDKLTPKHNDVWHIAQLLGRFLVGERRLFILALLMLIAEAGTSVFEAYPLAYLIDYLKGDRPDLIAFLGLPLSISPLIGTVAILTSAIILMAMINSLADSMAEIYLAKSGRQLGYNLRVALYSHLQRLSLAFHDKRRTGDILTRVTGDVAALEDFVIGSLSDIVGSLLLLVGTMSFLLTQSWEVSLVGAVIIPIMAFVSNYFSQRIKAAAKTQRAREGDLASAAQEMLTSIRVIQTYSRASYEQERFAVHSQKTMDAALIAAGLQARFSWVVKVMEALAIASVVWLGLWLMTRSTLTVGTLLLFIVLIQNMFKPTKKIIKEWNTIGKIYASVERIGELLDRKPTVIDEPGATEAPPFQGYVEFQNVSFAYQPDPEEADEATEGPPLALKDISFDISPGEVLALVGHTGAGKSTIAQLLPRLYDPAAGQILIDGHNIRTFTLDSLRSQISAVLQETILFSGTVIENIAYGRTDATREEIIEAAIQANAHEFIEKFPDGYDALLGERGANLSGGQRQRIAIARAFIRNAPILILDEPTTGLDVEAAELVLLALRTLMKGKTTIIISHDLKLIRDADKIVVIKEGEIEQVGTHEELLRSEGVYANLYFKHFGQLEVMPSDGEQKPEESAPPTRAPDVAHRNGRQAAVETVQPGGSAPAAHRLYDAAWLDLLRNPLIQSELPGLITAFDPAAMQEALQVALFGESSSYTIEQCTPGKATYLDGEGCVLRYALKVRDNESGALLEPLVNARIFVSQELCQAYLRDRLTPLAALMHGRNEITPFATPAAILESLNMVVSVFPIDGELPTLVGVTNNRRMLRIFRQVLPTALDEPFAVEACRVELGHYGRQHRCVLCYQVEGRRQDVGEPETRVIYGKIAVDGRGLIAGKAIAALSQQAGNGRHLYPFNIPRFLGYRRDLQLALLESIPGAPRINGLLKARLNGAAESETGTLTLDDALDAAARILAALHTSGISVGPKRTLTDELARLRREVATVQRISPEIGAQLQNRLAQVEIEAERTNPLPLLFSHGDFTHAQLLFEGTASGLVDFDTICQAEPALDLGQFLAYLRIVILKHHTQKMAALPAGAIAEQLCSRFLDTYIVTARGQSNSVDETQLRDRVPLYETISLVRIALHSWQKLKGGRLDHAMMLLEEH